MRIIIFLSAIIIFTKGTYSFRCQTCEISEHGETCDLSVACPKGVKSCETLISKVNGNYSIVLSCATEDNCESEFLQDGLSDCEHSE